MRAVLIDPFAYTVTEIAIERDPAAHSTLAAIYAALSHETMPVQCIEAVLLGRGEALFVDEEGAIKERYACGRARRGAKRPLRRHGWPARKRSWASARR